MARDGSSGVLGTFQTRTSPVVASTRQTSVNVPPESTPTRHMSAVPFQGASRSTDARRDIHARRWRQSNPAHRGVPVLTTRRYAFDEAQRILLSGILTHDPASASKPGSPSAPFQEDPGDPRRLRPHRAAHRGRRGRTGAESAVSAETRPLRDGGGPRGGLWDGGIQPPPRAPGGPSAGDRSLAGHGRGRAPSLPGVPEYRVRRRRRHRVGSAGRALRLRGVDRRAAAHAAAGDAREDDRRTERREASADQGPARLARPRAPPAPHPRTGRRPGLSAAAPSRRIWFKHGLDHARGEAAPAPLRDQGAGGRADAWRAEVTDHLLWGCYSIVWTKPR